MASIRGKNTKPEFRLRRALWAGGLRYRVHYPITGRPDIAFPGARVAVFVDGCFWHGCPDHFSAPKTNSRAWLEKISDNMSRDRRQTEELRQAGWIVLRIWEHDVTVSRLPSAVERVRSALRSSG